MALDLKGVWKGPLRGTNEGTVTIDAKNRCAGFIILEDKTLNNVTRAMFGGETAGNAIHATLKDFECNPRPTKVPASGIVNATFNEETDSIIGTFITDIGSSGLFVLKRDADVE